MEENFLPEEEQEVMLNHNPYGTNFIAILEHRRWNNAYQLGWGKGKFYACNKILDFIKEKRLNKEDFKEMIEFIVDRKLNL